MINLLEHIEENGRISMGMYITQCSVKGTPAEGWTHKIISGGKNIITLILAISGSSTASSVFVNVKSVSDISKEEIIELMEKLYHSYHYNEGFDLDWEDVRIMEPDEMIDMHIKVKHKFEHMIKYRKNKVE